MSENQPRNVKKFFFNKRWWILTTVLLVFFTLWTAEFQQANTTSVLVSTLRHSTPLVLGAMCGLLCERSGVINIGIEGQMLMSAWGGFMVASTSGSLLLGVFAGIGIGMMMGGVLAGISVGLRGDQIIAGTVINIAAIGITSFFFSLGRTLPSGKAQVIKLNLGEPDFPAPSHIKDEIKHQLDLDNTHYCDPQGLIGLRKAICVQVSQTRRIEVKPEQVVVFPGGKPPIGLAQQVYCNPGDEVIYPSPGFPIYESFIRYVDAVPVPLHLDETSDFMFSPEHLAELITPKTKLIYLNFPSNPTGGVASCEQLESIAKVIQERCSNEVRVYSDEIYENILFDDQKHHSIASMPGMASKSIIASGFSKTYAWTGGRIGYAIFPNSEEAGIFKNLNINYFSWCLTYRRRTPWTTFFIIRFSKYWL